MPARLYAFVPEEQNLSNAEREQLIEGLERELDEYYEQKCGKGSLETYLIQNEIWHLSEINYQVRAGYQKYLREYYVDSTVRNYLLGIDRVKLRLIIENAQTLKGKWNAQNHPELLHDILFLRYHPNPAIAKRYEYTTDISKLGFQGKRFRYMQTADFNGSGRYRATENNYERMHQTSKRIEKCI